jgi:hypothetical protein
VLQKDDRLVGSSRRLGAVGNAVHREDVVVCRDHCVGFSRVTILDDQLRLKETE